MLGLNKREADCDSGKISAMQCVVLVLVCARLCWGQSIYEIIEQIKAETEAKNARTNYLALAVAILIVVFFGVRIAW